MSITSLDGFDAFWAAYPRRQAKKDALKAWRALKPGPDLVQAIVQHVEQRLQTRQWREGFIPLPATFIRGERWEDELKVERVSFGRLSERMGQMMSRATLRDDVE